MRSSNDSKHQFERHCDKSRHAVSTVNANVLLARSLPLTALLRGCNITTIPISQPCCGTISRSRPGKCGVEFGHGVGHCTVERNYLELIGLIWRGFATRQLATAPGWLPVSASAERCLNRARALNWHPCRPALPPLPPTTTRPRLPEKFSGMAAYACSRWRRAIADGSQVGRNLIRHGRSPQHGGRAVQWNGANSGSVSSDSFARASSVVGWVTINPGNSMFLTR